MRQDSHIRSARRAFRSIFLLTAIVCLAWVQRAPDAYYLRVADSAFALLASYEHLEAKRGKHGGQESPLGEITIHPAQLTDSCALRLIPENIERRSHIGVGLSGLGNLRLETRPPAIRIWRIRMNCLLHPMGNGAIVQDAGGGFTLLPSLDLQIALFPVVSRSPAFRARLENGKVTGLEPKLFRRLVVQFVEDVAKRPFADSEVGLALQHLPHRAGTQRDIQILGTPVNRQFLLLAVAALMFVAAFCLFLNVNRLDSRLGGEHRLPLNADGRVERIAAAALWIGIGVCWGLVAAYWCTDGRGYDALVGLADALRQGSDVQDVPTIGMVSPIAVPVLILSGAGLTIEAFRRMRGLPAEAREQVE